MLPSNYNIITVLIKFENYSHGFIQHYVPKIGLVIKENNMITAFQCYSRQMNPSISYRV